MFAFTVLAQQDGKNPRLWGDVVNYIATEKAGPAKPALMQEF